MEQKCSERHFLMHSYAKEVCGFYFLPLLSWPTEVKRLEKGALCSGGGGVVGLGGGGGGLSRPLLSGLQSASRGGVTEHVTGQGLLLRGKVQITHLGPSNPPELQVLHSCRQKTRSVSLLSPICQRFELVKRETGGGKRRHRKKNVRKNSVFLHIQQPCLVLFRTLSQKI